MNTKTGINESQISKDRQVPKQSHMTLGNLSYGGHQEKILGNLMIQSQCWSCSKSKAGAPAAMLAHVESIVACKSSKANREIDRKTSRCWTNRKMWIPQIPTPRKASCAVLVHNSAHHLPWITGWKQEPAEETHLWILFCEIYK